MRRRNKPIDDAGAFGADRGADLMRADSDVMIGVLKDCTKAGVPALPVHDSVMTPTRYQGQAADFMQANFARRFPGAKPCGVRVSGDLVPHMPSPFASSLPLPLPSLSLPGVPRPANDGSAVALADGLPVGRLLETIKQAFGSGWPSKPVQLSLLDLLQDNRAPQQAVHADLEAYTGGLLPASLILLARDRRRALGMKQEEMARALGISRPQLPSE
jgi:hypothetical protein